MSADRAARALRAREDRSTDAILAELHALREAITGRPSRNIDMRERTRTAETGIRPLLIAENVAEMLGVTKSWVYAESRAGRIPTVMLGRYYRYRLEAIERWIESQEVRA